jgi:hypothetical protein
VIRCMMTFFLTGQAYGTSLGEATLFRFPSRFLPRRTWRRQTRYLSLNVPVGNAVAELPMNWKKP